MPQSSVAPCPLPSPAPAPSTHTLHHGARSPPRSRRIASSLTPRAQASGVSVGEDCLAKFQELKLGKKIKYIIFALNPTNTEIVVAKTSESPSWDEFVAELPEAECRWAVYDFEFEKEGAGKRNKLGFFSWCVPRVVVGTGA